MNGADFAYQYERYLAEARLARENDLHHDQRRELFLTFLDKAFGIDLSQVEREQYIQLHGQQDEDGRHGAVSARAGLTPSSAT